MGKTQALTAIACHDCDQLNASASLARGETAVCSRCGAVLGRGGHEVLIRTFAYALASLVLLAVALAFPFMEFKIAGRVQVAHLYTGVELLYAEGYWELAAMVMFTSILSPVIVIGGLLGLTSPILAGKRFPWMIGLGKLVTKIKVWSMMEVFLLGVIVSAIKLSAMADIVYGPGLIAFGVLILTSSAALAIFNPDSFWEYMDKERTA
jgi:paraquat-inducible protein A